MIHNLMRNPLIGNENWKQVEQSLSRQRAGWLLVVDWVFFHVYDYGGNHHMLAQLLTLPCNNPGIQISSEWQLRWKGSKVSSSLRLWTVFTAVLERCGGQSLALCCSTWHLKWDFVLIRLFSHHLKVQLNRNGMKLHMAENKSLINYGSLVWCGWQVLSKWMWGGFKQ